MQDIQVLSSLACLLLSGVAFAITSVGVPEIFIIAALRWRCADAAAHTGVEVISFVAIVRLAEATASQRVEVMAAGAILVNADALAKAICGHELISLGAGKRGAHTSACGLVPDFAGVASLNYAFELAILNVPSVPTNVFVNLGLADALAASLVPNLSNPVGVGRSAVMFAITLAIAVVKVPVVVIRASPSHTQAISGKCVELFPRVVAVLDFISAGAVLVIVED